MKSIIIKASVSLMIVLFCTPVFAQEKTHISITPRIWYAYQDIPVENYSSTETFSLPMYGGTLTLSPSFTPNISFLLTVFTGEGDGDVVVLFLAPDINAAKLEADRDDAELLVRYNLPNRNISLHVGGRYVTFDQTFIPSFIEYKAENELEFWVVEAGLGVTVNITENGRHRLFSNFTFGLSFIDWNYRDTDGLTATGDDTSPVIDFNAGYQYTVNERLSLSARYRLFTTIVNTEVIIGEVTQDKLVTIHGPEVALTVTF